MSAPIETVTVTPDPAIDWTLTVPGFLFVTEAASVAATPPADWTGAIAVQSAG